MTPNLVDDPEMQRLGWALLHFLWQGTLVALALKGSLMLADRNSPRFRYTLALASLLLMATLPVLLLCKPQEKTCAMPPAGEVVQLAATSAAVQTAAPAPSPSRPELRNEFFRLATPLVPWIAVFWLTGMALLLLKTVGGVIRVQILKRKATAHRDNHGGGASFCRAAAQSRVDGVPVLETGLVSVPTVAGWFKPAVLLPEGAAGEFDRPMLDALVAHELAHIRRHDCVTNLLQTVVENLFFFHPAIWWVSGSVRAEREACCDDDAVAICGDALVYARALSQAERFRSSQPVIALSSSPLLPRIRRLTEMRKSKMSRITAFCVALLAFSFIGVAATGSVLLASIPPLSSSSAVSASAPSGTQDSDKKSPETQNPAQSSRKAVPVTPPPPVVKPAAPRVPGEVKGSIVGGIRGDVKGGVPGSVVGGIVGGVPGGIQGGVEGPVPRRVVIVNPSDFVSGNTGETRHLTISGRIYDPTGAVVPGVSIALRNGATSVPLQESNAEGRFEISMDCPLNANLEFRMPGFLPSVYDCRSLQSGKLDVGLALAQGSNLVVITASRSDSSRASEKQPDRIFSGIKEPRLIRRTEPIYPQEARTRNIEGTVELKSFVDEEGVVKYATVLKGDPVLAQAAIDAVKQWKYSPAIINGQPWPAEVNVTVYFRMK